MLLSILINFPDRLNDLRSWLKLKTSFLDERGQSLVEFVLLLSIVMIISLTFLKLVNGKVADYWLAMGRMLTEDPNVQLELK